MLQEKANPMADRKRYSQLSNGNMQQEHELRINQSYTHSIGALHIVSELGKPNSIETTKVIFYPDNIREIQNISTGRSKYERKVILEEKEGPYFRYVTSQEIVVAPTQVLSSKPQGHTYRIRYIFNTILLDENISIHITFRTQTMEGPQKSISSSVSIEVETQTQLQMNKISQIADYIMKLHNGWQVPSLGNTVSAMKEILRQGNLRYPSQLQKPFDLTWKDITYQNLIERSTALSYKLDGTRMLLCQSNIGTFLVTGNLGIVPLNLLKSQSTSIFDGEILDNKLYLFDTLMYRGQNYLERSYLARHAVLPTLEIQTNLLWDMDNSIIPGEEIQEEQIKLQVLPKPIYVPETPSDFFEIVQDLQKVDLPTDGIILTPINQPYFRSVYKWKPQQLMTVDFFLGKNNVLHTFLDGELNPHPELELILPTEAQIGTVSEFKWEGGNKWSYMRDRKDKATPNSEQVFKAISQLHQDPITEKVISGNSLRLMRKYHNRVKNLIYDYLALKGVKTITDVGSGTGGDLSKWQDRFSVNAIEPDQRNISILQQRARDMGADVEQAYDGSPIFIVGSGLDVTLFPQTGQEYGAEDVNDALTLFNSATFFGPDSLVNIADNTVKMGGFLVILVIDGKCILEKYLKNGAYSSNLISISEVNCPESLETFGDLGCIEIQLKDSSTVDRPQVEGLVDVDVMLQELRKDGWIIDTDLFIDDEKLLGTEESRYTSCQRLLILQRSDPRNTVIRRIYTPIPVGQTKEFDTPYGRLIRVGVMDQDRSIEHSVLQATDIAYRKMNQISKVIRVATKPVKTSYPIYMIPEISWDIVSPTLVYPIGVSHPPGIVLFENNGHWEPLARKNMRGELQYIW